MNFLQISQNIPEVEPEIIFSIGGFPVTNSMMLVWLIIPLFMVFSYLLKKRLCLAPDKKTQLISEIIVEKTFALLDQVTRNREKTKKIFPIAGSIFIFFLISNIIILIPGPGALTIGEKSLFRTPTTDLNTTLAVAVLILILAQLFSIRSKGTLEHFGQYFQFKQVFKGFKQGLSQGAFSIINFVMGLLDIVGDFAKTISLSFRLFGNMFAGEVLMIVVMSFFAFVAPSLIVAQTLLIGVLQAVVFAILSAVYLSLAVDTPNSS